MPGGERLCFFRQHLCIGHDMFIFCKTGRAASVSPYAGRQGDGRTLFCCAAAFQPGRSCRRSRRFFRHRIRA